MDIFINKFMMPTLGGVLISAATSLNYCLLGEVTGMSGIVKSFWKRQQLEKNFTIIAGIISASLLLYQINPVIFFDTQRSLEVNLNSMGYALAGFLVGLGSTLGNGCTSGHGVCGLPRLSIRSIVYVPIFLIVAILSQNFIATKSAFKALFESDNSCCSKILFVVIVHIILGIMFFEMHKKKSQPQQPQPQPSQPSQLAESSQPTQASEHKEQPKSNHGPIIIYYMVGVIFGLGLGLAGMLRRSKIVGFLRFDANWDPSLLFVLGTAVTLNFFTFQYMIKKNESFVYKRKIFNPQKGIDTKMIIGGVLFGLGWGLGGLCPGPIIGLTPFLIPNISVYWLLSLIIGQQIGDMIDFDQLAQLLKTKKTQ